MHHCRDCGRDQQTASFRPDRRTRSGLSPRCDPCRAGQRLWTPEAVYALAMRLLPQERAELYAWLAPALSETGFHRSVRAIESQPDSSDGFRMLRL